MNKLLILFLLCFMSGFTIPSYAEPHVAVVRMNMMILPGTSAYLRRVIKEGEANGAKAVLVYLNTPGGILQTTQEMIQEIFQSSIPVIVYVAPEGATATSAGVFITMAGHVAVMAPGTSIGAAHPVQGDGKDIEGEMAKKATNMTVSMARSVSDQRNRNAAWVEKAVRESVSATDSEAVKEKIVDFSAKDTSEIFKKMVGKEVLIKGQKVTVTDLSSLPLREYELVTKEIALNFMSNPTVAAILWLVATTGITIELYNPGLVFPGVMGAICLILALMVTQAVPVNAGGLMLLGAGALMIIAELKVASGVLGAGGIIAIILGALYLVDTDLAPGLSVSLSVVLPIAASLGAFLLMIIFALRQSMRMKITTGKEGVIGSIATIPEGFVQTKQVLIQGALWRVQPVAGELAVGDTVRVVGMKGLTLLVEKA